MNDDWHNWKWWANSCEHFCTECGNKRTENNQLDRCTIKVWAKTKNDIAKARKANMEQLFPGYVDPIADWETLDPFNPTLPPRLMAFVFCLRCKVRTYAHEIRNPQPGFINSQYLEVPPHRCSA